MGSQMSDSTAAVLLSASAAVSIPMRKFLDKHASRIAGLGRELQDSDVWELYRKLKGKVTFEELKDGLELRICPDRVTRTSPASSMRQSSSALHRASLPSPNPSHSGSLMPPPTLVSPGGPKKEHGQLMHLGENGSALNQSDGCSHNFDQTSDMDLDETTDMLNMGGDGDVEDDFERELELITISMRKMGRDGVSSAWNALYKGTSSRLVKADGKYGGVFRRDKEKNLAEQLDEWKEQRDRMDALNAKRRDSKTGASAPKANRELKNLEWSLRG